MSTTTHARRNLYLAGLKHCGKTTLGKLLAARTGREFYDLDDLLLALAADQGYSSVREIYRTAGREKFQEYEAAAARKAAFSAALLSLGGGTVENQPALQALKPGGSLIYLQVDETVLFNRIERGGLPPFLIGDRPPAELFHELYIRRHKLYSQHCDALIELPDQTVEKNFELLYSRLKELNYVR
ncbi:MAG: shikimate kinase [Spirochaetota bacterium]